MKSHINKIVTLLIVAIAVVLVVAKYRDYLENPWTRDGQVRADVIEVTPRVSGPIVDLPIVDNQAVKAGDLLFKIDPRTYQAAYDQSKAQYDQVVQQLSSMDKQVEASRAAVAQAESQVVQAGTQVESTDATVVESGRQLERYAVLLKHGNTPQSNYDAQLRTHQVNLANQARAAAALTQAKSALAQANAELQSAITKRGAKGDDNVDLRSARAAMQQAKLNLEFTEQRASVDGFVTNLNLQLGSQANAGAPAMALVDRHSYWIDAYFREDIVGYIAKGNPAYITLMSYPDTVIEGQVNSIGWGISQQDGSTGSSLLPTVQPTFEWIRLAQRIPVRIALNVVPDNVELRVGTTASIMVKTGAASSDTSKPPPVPSALQ